MGDRELIVEEGEIDVTINKMPLRALFDPKTNFNAITLKAQKKVNLRTRTITAGDPDNPDALCCAPVFIKMDDGPVIPAILSVTYGRINKGCDILLGKPWMIGVEKYFEGYTFNNRRRDFVYRDTANRHKLRKKNHRADVKMLEPYTAVPDDPEQSDSKMEPTLGGVIGRLL